MKPSIFIISLFLLSRCLHAEVKLPSIFSDNMVLQQKSQVAIWGWSKSGKDVTIVSSWDGKKYVVKSDKNGDWKVKVNTPEAGGPYEMLISEENTIKLANILIGEVWLCSGQSNMEMPVKGFKGQPVIGSNDAILKSKNKNIRLITVPRSSKAEPQKDFKGQWQQASPAIVSEFSATAWYFGNFLNEVLDVPVGLINVSYGGSCIEAWMSKSTSEPFENTAIPEKGDSIKVPNRTPTTLFNGMLSPVIGYGIKGCIWYQGESNYKYPEKYERLFPTMVQEWRTLWGEGNFPFYYVQIAPYNYNQLTPKDTVKYNSAFLRDAQRKSMDKIPNCGMAVVIDIGEENCIHPADKETGGKRLAYWALAKSYNISGFGYISPTIDTMTVKDNSVVLTFKNIPNGLTSFGKELKCFEVAGANKQFFPATAILGRKSVILTSEKVINPVAARYAFKDFIIGDLYSTEGLPATSFRTDDW